MKISAIITLKKDVLDPQGKIIHQTLDGMGFKDINEIRQGKYFEIDVKENNPAKAKEMLQKTNGARSCNHNHQPIIATNLPHVPGAIGKWPILKHVANHSDNSTRSNSYSQEINCRLTARFVYRYVKPVKRVNIVTDKVR